MRKSGASEPPIRTKDMRTLFRAREITKRLAAEGLETAIGMARQLLTNEKSRQQYLQEMLPAHVACAIPGGTETFVIECAGAQCFRLQDGTAPLLWQITCLERNHDTQVIKIIHSSRQEQRVYWL